VILCCQQQNELVTQEPLLASNLVDLARQYTKWAHEVRTPEEVPLVLQRAFKETMAPPNGPVFVAIPWEFTMRRIGEHDRMKGITRVSPHFTGDPAAIAQAASLLAQAKNPLIVGGDAVGYANAWPELQQLAELIGAPVLLQTFSSLANYPNDDYHWQGELPGTQSGMRSVFRDHDVAFLCGFGAQAQVTVFKYSDGPLIPSSVQQIYLTNNSWDLGKNYYGESAVLGDIKATLPLINDLLRKSPLAGAAGRNETLRRLDAERRVQWDTYLAEAMRQEDIWAVVIAKALAKTIEERGLAKQFIYVHEAVSDPAPFQYLLPLGTEGAVPISYYCVAGGSLGWSMPASLGIKLEKSGWQGVETRLVINAVGDGSSLFYPQTWWTAARRDVSVLYIVTNNHEYHTLQIGLQQVVGAYGSAPGYGWRPKTENPDYLRIERPRLDFVALAAALGGQKGEVVKRPGDVEAAVRRAVDYVLQRQQSYILDMRTSPDTPAAPPTEATTKALARYASQPPLNIFHRHAAQGLHAAHDSEAGSNVPVIF
jgi:benzoylformate decarboxylase